MPNKTPHYIKNAAIADDQWFLQADVKTVTPYCIVELDWWLENRASCDVSPIGVALQPQHDPAVLEADLNRIELISIAFPSFADGRGYSIARQLRENFGFTGEIRAVGDVLQDQLFYMQRVGFNAFEIRADRSAEEALAGLKDFSVSYQADAIGGKPVYQG